MNKTNFAACLFAVSMLARGSLAQSSSGADRHHEKTDPTPTTAKPGGVIDLCQIPPPTKGGVGFSQQRLVTFDLGGESVTQGPEQEVDKDGKVLQGIEHRVFHQAGVHNHLRNVFFGSFPMERFHTVAAQVTAPAALTSKSSITHAEMIRAAELDPFAAYSIACADWVMFPRVSGKSATWQRVTKERKVGKNTVKYQAWSLSNEFEVEIDVYRFDEQSWRLARTVKADGGLVGLGTVLASAGDAVNQLMKAFSDEDERDAPGPLSAAPELTCRVPLVDELKDIADGYGKCGEATLAVTSSATNALKRNPKKSGVDSSKSDSTQDDATGSEQSETSPKDEAESKSTTDGAKDDGAKDEATTETEEQPVVPELDGLTREALEAASSGNPRRGIEGLTKQELGEHAPEGMVEAVGAAKVAVSTCKAGVDAVVSASQKLRSLVTQAPAETVRQAALGFAACAGVPLTYDLGKATPPGTEQMRSEYCKNLDERSDVTRGFAAMHDVALCIGRVSGEHATLAVQKDTKAIPGIKIEVPLLALATPQDNRFGLAIGKTEGVKRGDMYVAKDLNGGFLGFGFIVQQGPGGSTGARTPSHYRFRAGEAPVGSNMEEYPKVGLLLGARPQVSLILLKDELASSMLFGGAIEGGYNGGQFVGVGDEFWVRTNLAFLVGEEEERFFILEFVPEAQYYLFSRVAAFVQSGIGITFGNKKLPGPIPEQDVDLSGLAFSALLGVGLDIAVTPDWNTRLAVTGSQGISELTLKDKDELFTVEGGRLTTVQGTVSVDYSF